MSVRIYIPHDVKNRAVFIASSVMEKLRRFAEIVYPQDSQQPWENIPADVQAIITGWGGPTKLPRLAWESIPALRTIAVLGGSPAVIEDPIDAVESGVAIISASHAIAEGVAEETIGLMLAAQYELIDSACRFRTTGKLVTDGAHRNRSLAGSIIGLIGFGHTGQQVAERLRVFGVELRVFDPYVSAEKLKQYGARRVELDQLMSESDIISVHAGWTPETEGMIDEHYLDMVKPEALLVSTARMPLFDQAALIEKIRAGAFRFASDFVPFDAALWSGEDLHGSNQLIAVPGHTSITTRTVEQMGLLVAENLEAIFAGRAPRHAVSVEWIRHTTMLTPARH